MFTVREPWEHLERHTARVTIFCRGRKEAGWEGKTWEMANKRGKSCRVKTIVRTEEDGDNEKVRKCKSKAAEPNVKRGERT